VILDLNEAENRDESRECDVAVIGAGVAGLITACELALKGTRVVLLESGGLTQEEEAHPYNRVVNTAQEYRGAEHGRFRCLGGTSTRWGGALIPFRAGDLARPGHNGGGATWPIALDALLPHLPRAEAIFGLPPGPYELPGQAGNRPEATSFRMRAAKWPMFRNRNLAHVYAEQLKSMTGPQVWLNATLTRMDLDTGGRVGSLRASGAGGRTLTVRAREVVIAAGAIESTRIILQLDARHGNRLEAGREVMGRYFHDHLSAAVARIAVLDRGRLDRTTGFRFEASGMRNVRFEHDGEAWREGKLPGAFAHVTFASSDRGGFDGLRDIYRAFQKKAVPSAASLALLVRDAGWLARAAWARLAERRVLAPDRAEYEVHLVTEQIPAAENRIRLSDTERDALGVPLAEITWQVRRDDIDNSLALLELFAAYWSSTPLSRCGTLEIYSRDLWTNALASGGGIYHPGGSLRMARSKHEGVVDRDLRVFGVQNLRVISTACFPSGGSANPTMMLILFALRAVDQLSAELR
jgi:choline dehydrogenase-like flavoprotein